MNARRIYVVATIAALGISLFSYPVVARDGKGGGKGGGPGGGGHVSGGGPGGGRVSGGGPGPRTSGAPKSGPRTSGAPKSGPATPRSFSGPRPSGESAQPKSSESAQPKNAPSGSITRPGPERNPSVPSLRNTLPSTRNNLPSTQKKAPSTAPEPQQPAPRQNFSVRPGSNPPADNGPRIGIGADGRIDAKARPANPRGDVVRDGSSQSRNSQHSFHHGYWNHGPQNDGRPGTISGRNRSGSGNRFAGNNFAAGPYGYGLGYGPGYGFGSRGGLNSLLGIGLALSGLGGYGNYGYGGFGGYGGYGLAGGYPIGWGLGGYGLGGFAYNSGYLPYFNPYYASGMGGYNYARPVPTTIAQSPDPSAQQLFDAAVVQFRNGDYRQALTSVDDAIRQNPNDSVMHEFRALDLFALGEYPSAAATIHSVLAVGPGWDWSTMSDLYSNVDVYTGQLRALEQHVKQNPNAADARFLLAYHYITTGNTEAASQQLAEVVRLAPDDKLAADLMQMNRSNAAAQNATPPASNQTASQPNAERPAAEAAPIDAEALVGTWRAERPDGTKFELQLKPDKTFDWKVNQDGREQELSGSFGVEKDLLALESPQAGGMVAHVAQTGDDRFTFRLLGAPQDDQGLTFVR